MNIRAGVPLTSLKAAIFDCIKASGDIGISAEDIVRAVYPEQTKRPSRHTVKAHVWQINQLIAGSDYEIVSDRRNWFIRKNVV
jgi:hypothetical protein